MKALLLFCCLVPFAVNCFGQTTPSRECYQLSSDGSKAGIPPDMCAWILAHLAPGEDAGAVLDDGTYATVTADGTLHQRTLPPKFQSVLLLESMKRDIGLIEETVRADTDPSHPKTAMLEQALEAWSKLRENYCNWHPGETYTDYSDQKRVCAGIHAVSTKSSDSTTGDSAVLQRRPTQDKALLLFGGKDHKMFLGCLNCSLVDDSSVCNIVGKYGSIAEDKSIWDIAGDYGSIVSEYSPWNIVADSPSIIVDKEGNSYGYFTVNVAHSDRTRIPWLVSILDYHDEHDDLDKTRDHLCGDG